MSCNNKFHAKSTALEVVEGRDLTGIGVVVALVLELKLLELWPKPVLV